MAKLILGMNISLDGYVDDSEGTLVMPPPGPVLFNHWIEAVRNCAGSIYGRRMYEVMRYWDEDNPDWTPPLRDFAVVWRNLPKWVVSRTLQNVGPNATLIAGDIEAKVRELKASIPGTMSVAGPQIAGLMTQLGLIDEYHLYMRPFVLGRGKPFFHDARPPLRLLSSERIDDETVRLAYAPA
ncbi:MAG: dihydrofolate reductase family protein [Asticcacaulis sp.]